MSISSFLFIDLFNSDLTHTGGRKRAYVPKFMQKGPKDVKRRKIDESDRKGRTGKDGFKNKKDGFKNKKDGSKKNDSDGKKNGFKSDKEDFKRSGRKHKSAEGASAATKPIKKIKPKKKGKKKGHRNKNK